MLEQVGTPKERPYPFFAVIGEGRQLVAFKENATIFTQGDATEAVFFIRSGRVKLSVVSEGGKEATLGILSEGHFVGESGLAGQFRTSSATAMTDCVLMRIEKKAMTMAIRKDPTLATFFVQYLLERNIRHQEDLVDQLFNSSEKRLARILVLLADSGMKGMSGGVIPRLSQETLAEMVGTTRSRVSFFLNRFRKLGLIEYNAGDDLRVHSSLLQVVLGDESANWRFSETQLDSRREPGHRATPDFLEPPKELCASRTGRSTYEDRV